MINCIIQFQAVAEIITNENVKSPDILAKQHTKIYNAIYQNRLALDYLLASKGGVCRKFNPSNCCLQIDDKGKVTDEITEQGRLPIPVQTWRRQNPNGLFGG
jgi:hypothetical protein